VSSTATSTLSEQWGNDLVAGNNLLALYGVENIGGFEAIVPRSYVTYAQIAGAEISPAGRTLQFTKFDSTLLDALALKQVLLPAALRMPSRFRRVYDYGPVALFENRVALPRARIVRGFQGVKDEADAERWLRSGQVDLRATVLAESDHGLAENPDGGEVTWKESTPDRIVLETTCPRPSLLFLADTDYPGWEATVDGRPAEIHRANLAFRSVEVPAGTCRVEFRFRPASARHGLIASTIFLVLSLGASFVRRKP